MKNINNLEQLIKEASSRVIYTLSLEDHIKLMEIIENIPNIEDIININVNYFVYKGIFFSIGNFIWSDELVDIVCKADKIRGEYGIVDNTLPSGDKLKQGVKFNN